MKKAFQILQKNHGETLMEVVIAIAFFAIMVGMVATAFQASNKITIDNFVAREEMNTSLSEINKVKKKDDALGTPVKITIELNGKKHNKKNGVEETIELTLVKEGPFEKYVH